MRLMLGVAVLAANVIAVPAAIALDQSLPAYQAVTGISGQIKSVGSDTLGHEITLWAKAFKGLYPDVKIEIEASGSATAPPALLEGASQFGPMSRPMTAKEAEAFEKKYGYKASSFHVAVDALAIYVNKDNPVQCLAVQQLNRIFSSTRVVQGVASDRFAIGYSGIGYKTDGVRTIPLALYSGGPCYDTSAEATLSGKYPFTRYLRIYLNKKPTQPLDPLRAEFIKYILSKDGQTQTEKGGFYPITNEIREEELKRFGISTVP